MRIDGIAAGSARKRSSAMIQPRLRYRQLGGGAGMRDAKMQARHVICITSFIFWGPGGVFVPTMLLGTGRRRLHEASGVWAGRECLPRAVDCVGNRVISPAENSLASPISTIECSRILG
jgi:hypothetical protein